MGVIHLIFGNAFSKNLPGDFSGGGFLFTNSIIYILLAKLNQQNDNTTTNNNNNENISLGFLAYYTHFASSMSSTQD